MFNDFRPQPERTLSEVRDDLTKQQAHVDALLAEMHHHALIVADQHTMGGVDELSAVDYTAARERWEKAIRDMGDARMAARAENAIRLLRQVDPSRLTLLQGGAS